MKHIFHQLIFLFMAVSIPLPAFADPGLLLVAHGSSNPEWNKPVLELGIRIATEVARRGKFKAVQTALMEEAQPDIPKAVAQLEAAGCDRIIAVPLFIAPTSHTHFDVPAALGVYSSPKTTMALKQEGTEPARSRVPITLTQTVSEDDIILRYVVQEVLKLSKSPREEAFILLAHGDPDHNLLIDRLMRRIATNCSGETGIGYGDWAYIGVGQEFRHNGVPVIETALQYRKRVLVVGLYLSSSADRIYQRQIAPKSGKDAVSNLFTGKDVVFSEATIIQHPEFINWVLDSAYAALSPIVAERTVSIEGVVQ